MLQLAPRLVAGDDVDIHAALPGRVLGLDDAAGLRLDELHAGAKHRLRLALRLQLAQVRVLFRARLHVPCIMQSVWRCSVSAARALLRKAAAGAHLRLGQLLCVLLKEPAELGVPELVCQPRQLLHGSSGARGGGVCAEDCSAWPQTS